jgi:hypothetical protein
MVSNLLKLCLVKCSAGAYLKELAELSGGTLLVVERPSESSRWQVQATVDVVEHFVRDRSVDRLCAWSELSSSKLPECVRMLVSLSGS